MLDTGRMCMKVAGREAGKYCVVLKRIDKDFVLVTGPKNATGVKRRRCNVRHLEPTPIKINIKEDASDDEVLAAYEKEKIYEKLRISKPEMRKVSGEKEAAKEEKKGEGKKEKKVEKKGEKEGKAERKEEKKEPKKKETGKKKSKKEKKA